MMLHCAESGGADSSGGKADTGADGTTISRRATKASSSDCERVAEASTGQQAAAAQCHWRHGWRYRTILMTLILVSMYVYECFCQSCMKIYIKPVPELNVLYYSSWLTGMACETWVLKTKHVNFAFSAFFDGVSWTLGNTYSIIASKYTTAAISVHHLTPWCSTIS